ncbi:hypothetical protein LCGC14_1386220, partial [marine sediment metagenome]
MTYIKSRHDIGIVDVGSNGGGADLVGMMLALREDGSPAYEEYDGDFLVTQYATGTPSLVNMNPEQELPLFQNSWHAGFGQEYFDSALKYYRSIGMDLRHKGRALLGWTTGSISLPSITAVSITNAGVELDANWTTGAGIAGRNNTQKLSGTYSWRLGNAASNWAYQDLTYHANHIGHTFRFICWVYAGAVSSARIAIDDGDTTTYSSYHT